MFYIIENNNIQCANYMFENTCKEYSALTMEEYSAHPNKVIIVNNELQSNPNYEQEEATKRQAEFENKFLTLDTNKNYRLEPKGYANAQQSIDTVNNMVTYTGSLTEQIASMILFYETPDFTKPEECTEEWLIQHQFSAEPMTKEEWGAFYVDFTAKYAQKRYQQSLTE